MVGLGAEVEGGRSLGAESPGPAAFVEGDLQAPISWGDWSHRDLGGKTSNDFAFFVLLSVLSMLFSLLGMLNPVGESTKTGQGLKPTSPVSFALM